MGVEEAATRGWLHISGRNDSAFFDLKNAKGFAFSAKSYESA
jgi:hypothetical protein